jgi:hypothetical protein
MEKSVKLKVVEDYHGRVEYTAGQVIDVTPEMALWLRTDAPGCFSVVVEEAKEIPAPPKDKMVHKAKNK